MFPSEASWSRIRPAQFLELHLFADIQNFGNTEKKIPGVGEDLFAVQTPAKAPLLLALANQNSLLTTKGYLEQSEHYIESRLDTSSKNSSALYDASKDPFHDPGPHFELIRFILPHFSLTTIH
ncbi:hypothetical protein FOXYSP1_09393 [Fusarium oxysporum f. sp. phaseoli]